ncbi:MAG: ornithine carbamoyltransferase, partial [Chloroflexi bacterium]|nr:ornithine carbamoyltransferase [Chloroflexota bacterium]
PCQILADLMTVHERFGRIHDVTVAYVGDGNNVSRSLVEAAALAGFRLRVATPAGYEPNPTAVAAARAADCTVEVGNDPSGAVRDADVIYTDAWFSMGEEAEREARAAIFPPYRVDTELLSQAASHAIVMHCLPAHRGEEIAADVIDGPNSVVFDQAENRVHAQKALLAELLAGEA